MTHLARELKNIKITAEHQGEVFAEESQVHYLNLYSLETSLNSEMREFVAEEQRKRASSLETLAHLGLAVKWFIAIAVAMGVITAVLLACYFDKESAK